ncbi:MAG: hypothetical protein M3384_13005, partial [Acidobacteriota bacterium]|nr:hypothetical protein [Acidobacteriota bacterium]
PENRQRLLQLTGFVYALMLGALLLLVSYGGKWIENATPSNKSTIDWFIIGIIFIYYLSYLYLIIRPAVKRLLESSYLARLKPRFLSAAEKGKTASFYFKTLFIPPLIFSFVTLVLLYLINYGLVLPEISLWNIFVAVLQLLLIGAWSLACFALYLGFAGISAEESNSNSLKT